MEKLSREFLKWMTLALTVIGLLSILFMFINYNVGVSGNEQERKAHYVGNYLLGSECLCNTDKGYPMKSLFLETKLDDAEGGTCLYLPQTKVEVSLKNCRSRAKCSWGFGVDQDKTGDISASFNVAIRMNDGSVEPASMVVYV